MYTTYHLASAQEINSDILDAIKAAFKTKAITITVEEQDEVDLELTSDMKEILDQRLQEDQNDYISADETITNLKKKLNV